MIDDLLPQALVVEPRDGVVTWRSPLRIVTPTRFRDVVETFAADIARSVGWDVEFVDDVEHAQIRVVDTRDFEPEQYRILVDDCTDVYVSSRAGLSHAFTTIRQLGPVALWSKSCTTLDSFDLPTVLIDDRPAFAWRGVHLDVARHFFDADVVCRLIDLIAAHRLNRLHLHLNDDQGWRVEVPDWPLLTTVGSRRRSSPVGHETEGRSDDVEHAGFFSVDDLARIRAHAESRCVVVVPEIDLPGHAQAVIAAYPEFGNIDEPLEVWDRWGISEHVLNVNEGTLDFAEQVVRYVAGLFPGSPVHIGGDECPTVEWEASEQARQIMVERGFADARQLQGLFTDRLSAALHRDGHLVLAWDEVLDAPLHDDTIVCAWRSSSKAVEAAKRGFDTIMAPMQFVYLDWLNSDDPDEPVAIAPAPYSTPWEKVYGFRVVPPGLDASLRHHVLGAQAQLWTEYIATVEHLDYMAFPRLCAFSEVVWGTSTDVTAFTPRLTTHLGRLDVMGVNYRRLTGS